MEWPRNAGNETVRFLIAPSNARVAIDSWEPKGNSGADDCYALRLMAKENGAVLESMTKC